MLRGISHCLGFCQNCRVRALEDIVKILRIQGNVTHILMFDYGQNDYYKKAHSQGVYPNGAASKKELITAAPLFTFKSLSLIPGTSFTLAIWRTELVIPHGLC